MRPAAGSRSRRALRAWLALVIGMGALACSKPKPDPRYRPVESVLEVVAVLRRHVPDDTYRFEPARDFTGRNVYRASLLRLENLETVHADALRAGHMDDVIAFAKGRALERLRSYDLAAASYRRAADVEGPLRQEALESAALCDALAEAITLATEVDPAFQQLDVAAGGPGGAASPVDVAAGGPGGAASPPDVAAGPPDVDATLERFETRRALLEALLGEAGESHYGFVVREEIEQTDVARSHYLVDPRRTVADGDVRALAALQRVVVDHRESKEANRHLLSLADLYADLAVSYVESHPPESLSFDPPTFEELVTSAVRLYEAVANQDGATERLEAARQLEAFLAFTLRVDRDRFSQ